MKKFPLLTISRQSTEYSCGAAALQAVLRYWGKDLDETELMMLLKTSPESGTYPQDIVRVASDLGFQAEYKENLTLEEVKKSIDEGVPVIVLGQAWRSREDSKKAPEDEWADGHYLVLLGMDDNYVYLEDPYVKRGKMYATRKRFEKQWHNIRALTPSDTTKQMHLGIFIKGVKPIKSQTPEQFDLKKIDLRKFGAFHILAIRFPNDLVVDEIFEKLRPILLKNRDIVKPISFVFMNKDEEGNLSALEGGDLDDEEAMELGAIVSGLDGLRIGGIELAKEVAEGAEKSAGRTFGISEERVQQIANELPRGAWALLIVLEHLWAVPFRESIKELGGALITQEIITQEALSKLGSGTMTGYSTLKM
ncbi:MAG: C39 family peptidase [Methanotrichaceae archaeon]|nr:C39 family peptidase [Methanotrichaceae archaeon]